MRVVRSDRRAGQDPKLLMGLLFACAAVMMSAAGEQTFVIDAARSEVRIHVGKSGAFSFAGHEHEVSAPAVTGRVRYDAAGPSHSTVSVVFDATKLQVTGKNEPAKDVPDVQQTMLSEKVLDVGRFPKITFESKEVVVQSSQAGRLDLRVAGALTLHGQTRLVTAPVAVTID